MTNRYDHRKMAFESNPRWKKRAVDLENNSENPEKTFNERRQSLDTGSGLLGAGHNLPTNAGSFLSSQKVKKGERGGTSRGNFFYFFAYGVPIRASQENIELNPIFFFFLRLSAGP